MVHDISAHTVIGGSAVDRMLGILIERTEALREDTGELKSATGELRQTFGEVRVVMERLSDRLQRIETSPQIPDLNNRLLDCERGVSDFRAMRKRLWSGVWNLALAAVGGGGITAVVSHLWK